MLQISACQVCKTTAKIEVLGKTARNAILAQNIQAGTADARNEIDNEEKRILMTTTMTKAKKNPAVDAVNKATLTTLLAKIGLWQ